MSSTAENYLKRLEADPQVRLALLVCSAALQIDDRTAYDAVQLVAKTNGETHAAIERVKKLGCVWKEWKDYWHVTEDVRRELAAQLHRELPQTTIKKLRDLLALRADSRAALSEPADQFAAHEKLLASLEASYHRLTVPDRVEEGEDLLFKLWRELPSEAGKALAQSVDYLADELKEMTGRDLPDVVVFLQGLAAQAREDTHAQEKHFLKIWRDARHRSKRGFVQAKSAHLLALLVQDRDPKGAEKALRNSFQWMQEDHERGLVQFALGKLIEKDDDRRQEALEVYRESLELLPIKDQAQVHLRIAALLERGVVNPSYSQTITKQSLDQEIPLPESLFEDVEMSPEELRTRVESDMHQFCLRYLRARAPGKTIETVVLVDELYGHFFKVPGIWKDEADFFGSVAQLVRNILLDHAQNYPTLNIGFTQSANRSKLFGNPPKHDVLDLDEAVNRLQKIDPEQARLVELLFYAGLSPARVAKVMKTSETTVLQEWRFTRAFLKREVRRAGAVRRGINQPSIMMSRKSLSIELR